MLLVKVVVGNSVEAAYYAFVNDAYFVPNRKDPPMFYRKLSVPILGFNTEPGAWSRLLLMLGLLGRLIEHDDTTTIRFDENILKIAANNTTHKYEFEGCRIFDTTHLQLENKIRTPRPKTYLVLDDFQLSMLGNRWETLPNMEKDIDFAGKLYYYISDRVDGAHFITDCVLESKLTYEQINSFDYSDSMARFVVERHLKEVGVNGQFMTYYQSGKPKYRKPRVKHVGRFVYERDNNSYYDTKHVKITKKTLEEIVDEFRTNR